MALFGRKRAAGGPAASEATISAFWRWWRQEGRPLADAAIASGNWAGFPDVITSRLRSVHPDLEWETAAGRASEHALVISAGGMTELRPLSERVVRAAPPADATWAYYPARQPYADWAEARLELAPGQPIELSHARVSLTINDSRREVAVTVHHPAFGTIGEQERLRVTFLLLDWVLGEDGVERWLGEIAAASKPPPDALPVQALLETVAALEAREHNWVLGSGVLRGNPLIFSARRPLKWIDNPLLDQHVTVSLPYAGQTDQGFPETPDLELLRDFEDDLMARLGDRGLLAAHQSSQGIRLLHLYLDHTDAQALELVRTVAAGWPGALVEAQDDPGWKAVRQFA